MTLTARRASFWLIAVSVAASALLHALRYAGWFAAPGAVLTAAHWSVIAGLLLFAASRRSLTVWILVSMAVGFELGLDAPAFSRHLNLLSLLFLRLIKTLIAPLLFATLVNGVAGHSDVKKVGRMGLKALIFFEVVTTLALLIGLAAINISRAGVGIHLPPDTGAAAALPTQKLNAESMILHIVPDNIARAVAENQVLAVAVFSLLFGLALARVSPEKRRPMLAFTESLAETMFKFTHLVMYFAPFGVAGAVAYTLSTTGPGVLGNLGELVITLYAALGVCVLVVFVPAALVARLPLGRFAAAIAEPVSLAFATASSEAALPLAMERMEAFGVPRAMVAFVMPTGYSFNLVGSALYLSLASIFVAQAAGIHLSIGQQMLMLFSLMLTSKGVGGVARAALVILLATASSFGLPAAPVFLLLGVDQVMDMVRTAVNVAGNCLATAVVAQWEGELSIPASAADR